MENKNRPPARTQFLVFTLFGEYVLQRGGIIWTQDLLNLLSLLGVSERAARSTLSRMTRKGWLIARRYGRHSQYSLTARGWKLLKEGEQRIFAPLFPSWDGLWHLVVYSLPENKRRQRHSLRQRLAWLGFGSLTPGTWISPHNRKSDVESICRELTILEYVEIFSGMHLGNSKEKDLVRRCWDFPSLDAQYREFLKNYEQEYLQCLRNYDEKEHLTPEKCFARRFWLTYVFQSFSRKDPNLPTALLPEGWVGVTARELFDDYRQLLTSHANEFIDSIIKEGYLTQPR